MSDLSSLKMQNQQLNSKDVIKLKPGLLQEKFYERYLKDKRYLIMLFQFCRLKFKNGALSSSDNCFLITLRGSNNKKDKGHLAIFPGA